MAMEKEYLTLNEAAEYAGISRATLWRRMRAGELQTYQAAQDRRIRLVKRAEVDALMQPRPISYTPAEGQEAKTAA